MIVASRSFAAILSNAAAMAGDVDFLIAPAGTTLEELVIQSFTDKSAMTEPLPFFDGEPTRRDCLKFIRAAAARVVRTIDASKMLE